MTRPVITAREDASLTEVYELLREHVISAVPILSASGAISGVVSRTDLLHLGRFEPQVGGGHRFRLPDLPVTEVGRPPVVSLNASSHVDDAVEAMVERSVHRIFVIEGDALVGVYSAQDAIAPVAESSSRIPIGELASRDPLLVDAETPIESVVAKMDAQQVHEAVVLDEQWPVGVLTQRDVLAAKRWSPAAPVERAMSMRMVLLPDSMPVARAAGILASTHARRVVVVDEGPIALLTCRDLARSLLLERA